jgi:threonine dehydrogenase-like Zn-dependent dehydrogenase/FMN phosphatase YigB (HAD superfamily)
VDVDNTLYCEQQVKLVSGSGIEEQIVRNTHLFCQKHLNLTPQEADDLYRIYGSTIEGIRQTHPSSAHLLEQFYREVYDPIQVTPLIQKRRYHMDETGYSHAGDSVSSLREYLNHLSNPLYVASNSPSWHIIKVLKALGLEKVPWKGMLTPDLITHDPKLPFPTKAHPETFYADLLGRSCILIDDSLHNVKKAQDIGFRAIHVNHDNCTLEQALNQAVGHVDPDFQMKDLEYLKAKNVVDAQSIHGPTYLKIAQHLTVPANGILQVVDVGAGLLSMLELFLKGRHDKPPLLSLLDKKVKGMEYIAYEPNLGLLEGCKRRLRELGFEPLHEAHGSECTFHRARQNVTVHLKTMDFTLEVQGKMEPQLLVGCCFADLMDPHELVESLFQCTSSGDMLVYFPITFCGITQFLPPRPFGVGGERRRRRIPSDTTAFQMYSDVLTNQHGHNLEPTKLVSAMEAHGGILLNRGPSNWNICPKENEYLWTTMLYFFGTVGAPEMMKRGWDSVGWIHRAKQGRPKIEVSNVDLLFRLPREASGRLRESSSIENEDTDELSINEIQFRAPYEVGMVSKTVDTKDGAHLGPNDVVVRSVCSLISSGTELKIFKGMFDDAALDVNIDGMAEERMAYPLAYGYSLVGRVTQCGSDVADAQELLGRLVFTFSPHSSHVICDRNALHLVPDGIDAHDAIFMPSVETALSMVHDAHVYVGEKVAVFGQGLIGLLVTAILSSQSLPGTVTTFDGISERLAASASVGSSQALLPTEAAAAGPFDVSIEVSGNARALQSAIDNTRSGGRIIVGSWYGNADVTLKLGIDFHRSHKTIKTSQVSEIPAELTALWSKERRFALTWELVKRIRPSRLITRKTTLEHAKAAYDALDEGKEISVAFTYS